MMIVFENSITGIVSSSHLTLSINVGKLKSQIWIANDYIYIESMSFDEPSYELNE